MKKLISVLLAGLLVAAMGGCSGTDGSTAFAGEKLQVGIVQIMEHTSLDTIRESFLQQMEQLGYGEDPLNQRSSCGWKATSVAVRLCEEYMVRIESLSPVWSKKVKAN